MDASTRVESQVVGPLPLVVALLEQWGLAKIIDDHTPWEGDVPLGTLVEILIANRLICPQAMYQLGEWAQEAAVTDYFGLTAEQLNDDRFGRALERIADHREELQAALTLAAVKHWDLDVSQIHYDISTVEFFGAYEESKSLSTDTGSGPSPTCVPAVPHVTYGRTKSGRSDVKQIQFGLNILKDGGVPVALTPLDGNTAEARTHAANLRQLQEIFPRTPFLYMGDSKLDTPENLVAAHCTAGKFLCAAALTQTLQQRFRDARSKLKNIDYCSSADLQRPEAERDRYQACEVADQVAGTFAGKSVVVLHRLLFVHSTAKATRQAATRKRHLEKLRSELTQIQKIAGKYSLKTEAAITRRLGSVLGKYSEGKLFETSVTNGRQGLRVTWSINAAELSRLEELDGVFVLRTNETKKAKPTGDVLRSYREQSRVEKRIHHVKGPLAVAPMFLKNPKRIAGLLSILTWALTVLSLMERQVRKNLDGEPMYGLLPENRPSPAPSGPKLLKKFENLSVIIIHEHGETYRRLSQLKPIQRKILELLDVPDTGLRTFKRRCGM